jgi:hypothetical protein
MNKTDRNTDRYIPIVTAMLRDVQERHAVVYTPQDMELDANLIKSRVSSDGMSFLTKTLPALGKAFDRALTEIETLKPTDIPTREYLDIRVGEGLIASSHKICLVASHSLFGKLFSRVLNPDGAVLPSPDVDCVRSIRQLCYTFYKLELPYSLEEEQKVIDQFVKTEHDISSYNRDFGYLADLLDAAPTKTDGSTNVDAIHYLESVYQRVQPPEYRSVIRDARKLLASLFQRFDPRAIVPQHGPGTVSTKEKLHGKYMSRRVNPRIDEVYPWHEYFVASGGHLVDELEHILSLRSGEDGLRKVLGSVTSLEDSFQAGLQKVLIAPSTVPAKGAVIRPKGLIVRECSARVILVPKDSRGPRLISCEPLENQWVQQGLMKAIVGLVEKDPLTRHSVHFTDQQPNQFAALQGSRAGAYATLDLKEASDRVTVGLVRLLFPQELSEYLLATRTKSTMLPNGEIQRLDKFAPMGSALCFPVMALTIWALLTARFRGDAHARQSLHVYGDDVIVPGYQAQNAIATLEAFGLLVNRAKSCVSGFFRESCGTDAFRGVRVTPVRVRTLWTSRPSPKSYLSHIAYANAFRKNGYNNVSDAITEWLCRLYGEVPCSDMYLNVPALTVVPEAHRPRKSRINARLQKREWYVYSPRAQVVKRQIPGWLMLLRYFSETGSTDRAPGLWLSDILNDKPRRSGMEALNCVDYMVLPFSVRSYTPRDSVVLEKSWR